MDYIRTEWSRSSFNDHFVAVVRNSELPEVSKEPTEINSHQKKNLCEKYDVYSALDEEGQLDQNQGNVLVSLVTQSSLLVVASLKIKICGN